MHFEDSEPTLANPLPILKMGYEGTNRRVRRMVFTLGEKGKVLIPKSPTHILSEKPVCAHPQDEILSREELKVSWVINVMILMFRVKVWEMKRGCKIVD